MKHEKGKMAKLERIAEAEKVEHKILKSKKSPKVLEKAYANAFSSKKGKK